MWSGIVKWCQTIGMAINNLLAYRVNFFLLVIGPSLVFFLIKYQLFHTLYQTQNLQSIRGYSQADMLTYQSWVLIVTLLAQSHNSTRLAEDIRLGRITPFLLYPFSLFQFHACNFLALFMIQSLTVCVFAAILVYSDTLRNLGHGVVPGLALIFLVAVLWFLLQYAIGLLSFWLEQTWVMRVLFQILAQFMSGALLPLELYPQTLRDLILWTPFPYLTWMPARICMYGTDSFSTHLLILGFWILLAYLLVRLIWNRGLRMYTAAGM